MLQVTNRDYQQRVFTDKVTSSKSDNFTTNIGNESESDKPRDKCSVTNVASDGKLKVKGKLRTMKVISE